MVPLITKEVRQGIPCVPRSCSDQILVFISHFWEYAQAHTPLESFPELPTTHSEARPVTALTCVVAELSWSSWDETDVEDCLTYLCGSDRLKIPPEWVEHVPTAEQIKSWVV